MKKRVKYNIQPSEQHWVGDGFHVHTLIQPHEDLYHYTSPFVLLDYAPPIHFGPTDKKRGVGEHPHRGFETVTLALNGEVSHRDSSGGGGTVRDGGVQWMSAASGVVHEEYHSEDFSSRGGLFEMVQLWVNLPAKNKMGTPRYQDIEEGEFGRTEVGDAEIKVIAGKLNGVFGIAKTYTDITIFQAILNGSCLVPLEDGHNTSILITRGSIELDGKSYDEKQVVIFEREGSELLIKSRGESEFIIFSGEPIEEPLVTHGPFVMNTKEEISQAIKDYKEGRMGTLEN